VKIHRKPVKLHWEPVKLHWMTSVTALKFPVAPGSLEFAKRVGSQVLGNSQPGEVCQLSPPSGGGVFTITRALEGLGFLINKEAVYTVFQSE